ncbi:MAG TPA: hypothetical protein VFR76_04575 [Verrucomicrobiae bacterium]|nr:hypothetical protein [Verrucomicrobiae bacterium]
MLRSGMPSPENEAHAEGRREFTTTHWSVVLAASHSLVPGAQEALETLCRTYWYPLLGNRHAPKPPTVSQCPSALLRRKPSTGPPPHTP